jgi:phosphoribosylanthranilate isomerase
MELIASLEQESRPAVKLCGPTTPDSARAIAHSGADLMGINFWPSSPRFLTIDAACDLLRSLHLSATSSPAPVAVLVDPDDLALDQIVASGLFAALQLHGDESPARCAQIARLGLPLIKSLSLTSLDQIAAAALYPLRYLLIDAHDPVRRGGTGSSADWSLAARAAAQLTSHRILLAGGLKPSNVAAAIHAVHPAGVDSASGVESTPGIKDPELCAAFTLAAHSA